MSIRLLSLVLVCVCLAGATGPPEIGWVLSYSPLSAEHKIERNHASLSLSLGTPLIAGDAIHIIDGSVRVGFVDGSERHFSGPGNWKIPTIERNSNVWQAMQSLLGMVKRQGILAASASTRDSGDCITGSGGKLRLPLFERPQKVVQGVQDLRLAWEGGCANFSISLSAGDQQISSRSALKDRDTVFHNVDLRPGKYEIRIASASDSVAAMFEVVDMAPDEFNATIDSSVMHTLMTAAWLADHEQGSWRAESLKTLQPLLKAREPMAIRLADWLLHETDDQPQ